MRFPSPGPQGMLAHRSVLSSALGDGSRVGAAHTTCLDRAVARCERCAGATRPAEGRAIHGRSATRPRAATLARCPAGGGQAGRPPGRPAQDLRGRGAGGRQDLRDAAGGARQARGGRGRRRRRGRDARPQGDRGAAGGPGGPAAQADHLRQPHPERVRHRRRAQAAARASSWSTSWRTPTFPAAATPSATRTSRSCWRTASTSTPPSTSSTSRA